MSEYKGILEFLKVHSSYTIDVGKVNLVDQFLGLLKALRFMELRGNLQEGCCTSNGSNKTFIIHTNNSIHIIRPSEIIMVQGDGSYSSIYLIDGRKITSSKNLGHFVKLLDHSRFFRTHQSYLINLSCVKSITKSEGLEVELVEGKTALLSKSRKQMLLNSLIAQ